MAEDKLESQPRDARTIGKPLKKRVRRTVTIVAAAAAVLGAAAWFKINREYLDEYFAGVADLFRYVSFHRR